MGVDDVAMGVLNRLNESHQLICGDLTLMFNLDNMSDMVALNGPTTQHHRVTFKDDDLFDYVNGIANPVTEELVLTTLCDIYRRPERYRWVKKASRR